MGKNVDNLVEQHPGVVVKQTRRRLLHPSDRVAAQPTRYFLEYSNFGKALIASLVAPDSTNLPSCCFN